MSVLKSGRDRLSRRPKGIPFSSQELSELIANFDDDDAVRFTYTVLLGRVFSSISMLEDSVVSALWFANRIEVRGLDPSFGSFDEHMKKRDTLQQMTFGNLIKVLESNAACGADLSYLNFVKRQRDYFVHRFFIDNPAPGDLTIHGAETVFRKLRYLEIVFWRASRRVWLVLGSNGYAQVTDLGPSGLLVMNDLSNL